jgi:hypothetical protein
MFPRRGAAGGGGEDLHLLRLERPALGFYKRTHNPKWVGLEHPGDLKKLDHIKPPLSPLVFGDEGLWPTQGARHLLLGQSGPLASRDQQFPEMQVLGGVDGFAHAARQESRERDKLIPVSDYPK